MSDKNRKSDQFSDLDPQLQRELDEALGDMSIEQLMEAETAKPSGNLSGEAPSAEGVRRGKIIAIQGDDIFVELGGKSQGFLPVSQFEDEPLPEVGSEIEVTIERYDQRDGLLMLSRKGAVMAATWETLDEGQTVEARVTGFNKGGLELLINGIGAFMPISQIELFRVETLDDYVNQRLRCQVMEIDRRDENVIVSRRALLELDAEETRKKLLDSIEVGQIFRGVVRSIMPYGAFVDIGGIDGLLHVSDMSHTRVENPESVVKVSEQLDVKVLKFDREEMRISLGLKQVLPDPWSTVESKWSANDVITGRVTRLADFGAFVELEPGVEGLIPISELSYEHVRHPSKILSSGDTVKVRVLSVDAPNKRLGLSLKRVGDDPWIGASVRWAEGSIVEARISRIVDFGAFVELSAGVEGLIHVSELSNEFVRTVSDAVCQGDLIQAKVLSVDESAHRISLSIKQAIESPEYTNLEASETTSPNHQPQRTKPLKGGLN